MATTGKPIHELTRNNSKQNPYFLPFRVISWIAFLLGHGKRIASLKNRKLNEVPVATAPLL